MQKENDIKALEVAILIAHHCWPTHLGTVLVREKTDENVIVWEGAVELFALAGHEKAKKCYAWQHIDADGHLKAVTVLGTEFVDSARRAVQAAIFTDVQPALPNHSDAIELFKQRLQEAERILYESKIKAEDLDAAIQKLREIKARIDQRRDAA